MQRLTAQIFVLGAAIGLSIAANSNNAPEQVTHSRFGEALIVPFFSAQNGWDTYINVEPTTERLHMKIRDAHTGAVRAAYNIYYIKRFNRSAQQRRLAFTLYKDPDGRSRAAFANSLSGPICLVGGDEDEPISFIVDDYSQVVGFDLPVDQGSVELYAMPASLAERWEESLTCERIAERWQKRGTIVEEGSFSDDGPALLSAEVNLINVARGLLSGYQATALRGLNLPAEHFHPTLNNYDLSRAEGGIAAVADALSVASLTNEVVQLKDINAATEWVVSYPLAGYMNHKPYTTDLGHTTQWCDSFGVYPTTSAEPAASVQVNQQQGVTALQPQDTEYSPTRPAGLCHAVNVVGFGAEPVLADAGAENWVQAPRTLVDLLNGRASVLTWALPAERTQPRVPMLGFRLTTFENGTLDGGKVLANYSLLTPHKRD